jgi:hypothetical protein
MKKILILSAISVLLSGSFILSKATDSVQDNKTGEIYAGNWTGHGAGEEVRFRHKRGMLTLTVKHKTEFVFSVDKDGKITGEGSIEYDLTNNTTGMDNLVAGVHALMGLASTPGTMGNLPQKTGDQMRDVKGVTKIQYNAPHLKNGVEIRYFKFTGHIKKGMIKDKNSKQTKKTLIYLDVVKNFTLPDGTPNNTLIAEYEVNNVRSNPTFPCWSPFLKSPGFIRKGPGTIHIGQFMEKGNHREGKKVWEEYSYVWIARLVSSAKAE